MRAAKSVAMTEELLAYLLLTQFAARQGGGTMNLVVVENLRPEAKVVASSVHRVAVGLMDKL